MSDSELRAADERAIMRRDSRAGPGRDMHAIDTHVIYATDPKAAFPGMEIRIFAPSRGCGGKKLW
jgi:hypothetical protein